ncbi:MAG TPA: TRAP transporter small permease subunit [Saliniramus sp.]|nr:TRAP transporter small permease subunit [Saliniramus sp.]
MKLPLLVRAASNLAAWIDRTFLIGLVAAIALLVLMNVGTRLFGFTISWADELAVYFMILAGFVGASLMLRLRTDPAVTLLHEFLPEPAVRGLRGAVAVIALVFGLVLAWLCWRWFNLPGLYAAGFDIRRFEGSTFNFIYTEMTPVMGLPAMIFFLIVPWFALTISIHAMTNLLEEAGVLEREQAAKDAMVGEG